MLEDVPASAGLTRIIDDLQSRLDELRGASTTSTDESLVAELDTAHEELKVADEEIRVQQAELDRLVRHQHAADRVHEQFLSLLPAAVLLTDGSGAIRFANAAAAVMLGVRLDRLVGKPVFAFVDTVDRGDLRRLLSVVTSGQETKARRLVTVTGRGPRPAAVEIALTATAHPYRTEQQVTWVLLGEDGAHRPRSGEVLAPLASTLLQITQLPVVTTDPDEILQRVVPLCQRAFAVPVAASLCLGPPVAPNALATDSEVAQAADGAQVLAGGGPCQDAYEQREIVASNDLLADPRWPRLHERFERLGLHAAIAVPVLVADDVAGCLNIYSADPGLVTDAHRSGADLLAGAVAAVLHENDVKRELAAVAEQMRTALVSRATIDQAKGILMARHGYDADAAFSALVALSSRSQTKVRDVAASLVREAARETTR